MGTVTTAPITFSASAATTATAIQTALRTLLEPSPAPANFTALTVTGTLSGNTYTFKVTFGMDPDEPDIQYVAALPATLTFTNSVTAPAASQQLTLTPASVPVNGTYALQVGAVTTAPIYFDSTNPATAASNMQVALVTAGFAGTTVTLDPSSTATSFVFDVTFTSAQAAIQYAGALPATVTFANSVAAPAPAQTLTFTAASVPVNGTFALQVGTVATAPIYFDSTNPTNTAANIQNALVNAGFAGATVSLDASSTTTTFVFDVIFTGSEAAVALAFTPTLPTAFYTSATTVQWANADLLPYFNPLATGAANPLVGAKSPSGGSILYQELAASWGGNPEGSINPQLWNNFTVTYSIDKVLFQAEYDPPTGTAAATQTQLGRLQAILESVAGLLSGDSNGVMTSQWDANSVDSQNATYSDNIVSTQRDGLNQSYYVVVPYDVQQGTFQLTLSVGPVVTSPDDVVPPSGTTVTTGIITMPSTQAGEPGGPINDQTTMNNISAAINAALGQVVGGWEGTVLVREVAGGLVGSQEIDARTGTDFAVPTLVEKAETPAQFITTATQQPATQLNSRNAFVFELTFEGQAHDIPVSLGLGPTPAADQQWIQTATKTTTGSPPTTTTTYTYALGGASPPVVLPGDYTGTQGSPQYNASIALTSAGSMVAAYTSQSLLSDQATPATDALGNSLSNIYYNNLPESTDTAGPRVVGWSDGNGVDLLNAPRASATGVNAKYMVLTFDEPMLADNPAIDPDSVYNPANYQIFDNNGNLLSNLVTHIDYGLSEVSQVATLYGFQNTNSSSTIPDNRWEVVLTLNDAANNGPLPDGTYTLKVLTAEHSTNGGQTGLCNIYGTPLNLTGYNQPQSVGFSATITISASTNPGTAPVALGTQQTDTPINYVPYRGSQQIDPAVSTTNDLGGTALNGNYVVVWTSDIKGQTNIVGQLYKSSGVQVGSEFQVNTTASTSWGTPDVAMDSAGDFVVVWSGFGPNSNATTNPSDIYARAYNAQGDALTSQFLVDQYVFGVQQSGVQNQPRVAMSPDGTFVITWTGTPIYLNLSNTTSYNSAIFAREYDQTDVPLGNEFQVTPSSANANTLSDVSMDANDNFVVTWEGDIQNSQTWGTYGDYFTAKGGSATTLPTTWTSTGPMLLNNTPNSRGSFTGVTTVDLQDKGPRVAMEPSTAGGAGRFRGNLGQLHQRCQRLRRAGAGIHRQRRGHCQRRFEHGSGDHGQPDPGQLAVDARRGR